MNRRSKTVIALAALGALGIAWAARRAAYSLRGRTVLITGGSRGLGLVLAREFAREGARLVLCARDADELEAARVELESSGAEVLTVCADVTLLSDIEAVRAATAERFGAIDVLVNNAGRIVVGPLDAMTDEDFERAMATHFWAPLRLTRAVLPEMRARGDGRVVNISSVGGLVSLPHMVPYCASKFALGGLSEGMRAELAGTGVKVTTVYPGLMRTGSARNATFKGQHRAEYAWFALSDALPFTSMSAERAAWRIVAACRRGDARLVLSLHAKAAALAHGVFPSAVQGVMDLVAQAMPAQGDAGTESHTGAESGSPLTRSVLTTLDERAAQKNNELPARRSSQVH